MNISWFHEFRFSRLRRHLKFYDKFCSPYPIVDFLRPFSTRRNFPPGMIFSFVFWRPLSTNWSLKATFHLTISMRGKLATGKIQRNSYRHGSCGPSLRGKTMSVFLIFTQGTHRNVKNRWVRSSLKGYFSLNNFYAWAACNGQNSKE